MDSHSPSPESDEMLTPRQRSHSSEQIKTRSRNACSQSEDVNRQHYSLYSEEERPRTVNVARCKKEAKSQGMKPDVSRSMTLPRNFSSRNKFKRTHSQDGEDRVKSYTKSWTVTRSRCNSEVNLADHYDTPSRSRTTSNSSHDDHFKNVFAAFTKPLHVKAGERADVVARCAGNNGISFMTERFDQLTEELQSSKPELSKDLKSAVKSAGEPPPFLSSPKTSSMLASSTGPLLPLRQLGSASSRPRTAKVTCGEFLGLSYVSECYSLGTMSPRHHCLLCGTCVVSVCSDPSLFQTPNKQSELAHALSGGSIDNEELTKLQHLHAQVDLFRFKSLGS